MSQDTRARLLARVRRLKGQVEAIERALEADPDSSDVLRLLAAVRGAANGISAEVIGHHILRCAAPGEADQDGGRAADELVALVRTYLR